MSFTSWLRNLRSFYHLGTTTRKSRWAARSGPAKRFRPSVERLEDRTVPAFLAPVDYGVGSFPHGVVAADFNNDTVLDLAVINDGIDANGNSNVSVLLGNVDGTFQPARNSATGASPQSVAVGDFNADGELDLATANAGDVSVLRGNGDGTFQAPSSMGVDGNPQSLAVGDFNADGKMDLGVTSNIYHPGTPGTPGYWVYYPGYWRQGSGGRGQDPFPKGLTYSASCFPPSRKNAICKRLARGGIMREQVPDQRSDINAHWPTDGSTAASAQVSPAA